MAKNGFKVFDSDMHLMEPPDLWQRYIDSDFRDRAPKGFQRWYADASVEIEGHFMPLEPADWSESVAAEKSDAYKISRERNWDASSQVLAMDMEGIDLAVLYPTRGLMVLGVDNLDPGLAAAVSSAYNDWLYDFCSHSPDKLYGAAMVSPFDVESAIAESRRSVVDMGMKAIFLRPTRVNSRNWHDRYYDPLWAEIEQLGVPLGFHEGSGAVIREAGDRFGLNYMMRHTCDHPMEMMLAMVSFICGGVLERFPNLKVGFLEANCAWVPWLVWRMDEHFELSGHFESPELKHEAREYFQRQCYVSVEPDEEPAKLMETWGFTDNMVFSTDYPHNDAKFPEATESFLTLPFSEEAKRKILWDNCARLYGL